MLTSVIFGANVGPNQLQMTNNYAYTLAGNVSTKTLSLLSPTHNNSTGSVSVNYTYDNQGVLSTIAPTGAPTLTYSLDALERPSGLTDSNLTTWASGATYNPANQITGGILNGITWTWNYNSLLQVTTETATAASHTWLNMDYYYHAGGNNGQMYQSKNFALSTAETITYNYDLLKRLTSASSSTGWSESYTNDPFGNLTGMAGAGGAPNLSVTANPQTNQISPTGITYDNYGNVTYLPALSMSLGYDVANRMVSAGSDTYAYDQANRRVYHYNGSAETIYLYGKGGKLATYTISVTNTAITPTLASENIYFAGKLISAEGNAVAVDRLGSVRWSAGPSTKHSYFPYGVEYTATTNDTEKYATYTRDTVTGLDYAMNRYYNSIWARFLSPDQHGGDISNPQSLNRYAYASGDAINLYDPRGTDYCDPNNPGACFCWDTGFESDGEYVESTTCLGGVGQSSQGTGARYSPKWVALISSLYQMNAAALTSYAHQFAKALLSENFSADCAKDLADLGKTPEQWANALNNVSVLNGVWSNVALASILPNGGDAQKAAQRLNLTVASDFTPGSNVTAVGSVNGPQVFINPLMVNPFDFNEGSGLIAHETLHNLGLTDQTIQMDLGLKVDPNNTKNISDKLQQDCFPGSSPAPMP